MDWKEELRRLLTEIYTRANLIQGYREEKFKKNGTPWDRVCQAYNDAGVIKQLSLEAKDNIERLQIQGLDY